MLLKNNCDLKSFCLNNMYLHQSLFFFDTCSRKCNEESNNMQTKQYCYVFYLIKRYSKKHQCCYPLYLNPMSLQSFDLCTKVLSLLCVSQSETLASGSRIYLINTQLLLNRLRTGNIPDIISYPLQRLNNTHAV